MIFLKFFFILQFLITFCISSDIAKFAKLKIVLDFLKSPDRREKRFEKYQYPVRILFECYEADKETCLNEVYKLNFIPLEELFFSFLTGFFYTYSIPLNLNTDYLHQSIVWSSDRMKVVVWNLFIKPFVTEEEMIKRFSIIKLYIKFAKRYVGYTELWSNKTTMNELASQIEDWEFSIRVFPLISPNGKIDYSQFFSTFNWIMRPKNKNLTTFVKSQKNNFFLFAIILNQMVALKDPDLFKFEYPELPFLLALLLKRVSNFGNNIFPSYFQLADYSTYLRQFFGYSTRKKLLDLALENKNKLLKLAEEEIGLDPDFPNSLSLLIDSFERVPFVCQSENHHNLLWQLKGISFILEGFGKGKNKKNE
jgi:hypothetical protein